jgi:DNA-binding MarR family transcriptional regulator
MTTSGLALSHLADEPLTAIDDEMVLERWLLQASNYVRAHYRCSLYHFWILLLLSEHQPIALKDMARLIELNYTTVAEGVDDLVEEGFIVKSEDEHDGRSTILNLTAAGVTLLREIDRDLMEVARRAFTSLAGQARLQAMELFYKASHRFDKKRMVDNLARADSCFLITCQECTLRFASICKQNLTTAQQGHLLLAIGRQGRPLSSKEARFMLGYDAATLSRLISKCESQGLIAREQGATKREVSLSLTSSGLQCASLIASASNKVLDFLFGDDYLSNTYHQTMNALRLSLEEA